jgi:uncharacterized membrane protein
MVGEFPFRKGDGLRPAWLRALEWVGLPFYVVALPVHFAPLGTIAAISLFRAFSLPALYALLVALLTDLLLTFFTWRLEAITRYWDLLVNYLDRTLRGRCRIEEADFLELLPARSQLIILAARVASTRVRTRLVRLFVIHPTADYDFAERKGFSIPMGGEGVDGRPRPDSMVFVRDHPRRMSSSGWYQLCHEVGHATKHAWRARIRFVKGAVVSVAIAIWLLASGLQWLTCLGFTLTYFVARVGLDYAYTFFAHGNLSAADEAIADKFALNILPPRLNLRHLRKVIVFNSGRNRNNQNERNRAWRLSRLFLHSAAERSVPLDNTWDTMTNGAAVVLGAAVISFSYFVAAPTSVYAVHNWHHALVVLAGSCGILRFTAFGCATALGQLLDDLSKPAGQADNVVEKRRTWLQWLLVITTLDLPAFLREVEFEQDDREFVLWLCRRALLALVLVSLLVFAVWALPTWLFGQPANLS